MRIIPPRLLARPRVRASRRAQGGWIVNPYRLAVDEGGGGGGDPYFSSVVQLAHFDGSNGSTTLTNSCPRGNTMTVLGTSTISTAQSKWGGASLRSPNTSAGCTGANNSDYGFEHGAFTIEGWFRLDSVAGNSVYFSWADDGPLVYSDASGVVRLYVDSSARITSSAGVAVATTWQFISVCSVGASIGVNRNMYLHVDGVYIGTWTSTFGYSTPGRVNVFYDAYGIGAVGYADDFRVTKGVCRYGASNYSVPTEAHPDS